MSIKVEVDGERGLITRTIEGETSLEELIESIEAVIAHPDFRPGMKSLTDLRDAAPVKNPDDVKKLVKTLASHNSTIAGVKVAVVTPEAVAFGMMRMVQAYAGKTEAEVGVFYEMSKAREWLGLDDG